MLERSLFVIVGCLLVALSGCARDGYGELGLVPVTGKVTLDGQPLTSAKVSFEGDDKRAAIGTTDSAGNYKLMYDSEKAGTTPGPKVVRITQANTEVEGGGASEGTAAVKEPVPPQYNVKSELKADVSASNAAINFELKTNP